MQHESSAIVTGTAFARCVIDCYPTSAGDVLLKSAGECERDWLELKASFYVRPDDPDFRNTRLLAGKPQGYSDADWLNELNLGRIAQTILAMYNTRGGIVLVGVAPGRDHAPVPLASNDPHGILASGSRDLGDYIDDAVSRLVKLGRYTKGSVYEVPSNLGDLFAWKIIRYREQEICALIVKTCPFALHVGVRRISDGCQVVFSRDLKASGKNVSCDVSNARRLDEFSLSRKSVLLDSELRRLVSATSGPAYCAPEMLARYLEKLGNVISENQTDVPEGMSGDFRASQASIGESWRRLWTFSVSGRAPRSEFWADIGFFLLFACACSFLRRVFWNLFIGDVFSLLPHLAIVLLIPPMVRRLHDMGRSGWVVGALPFLYYIDTVFPDAMNAQMICLGAVDIALLVLGCAPGKAEPTKYDMMRAEKRQKGCLLAGSLVLLAFFGLRSLIVPDVSLPDWDMDLGTPPSTYTKMDEMVFNQIKAFGCIYQDRYERDVSPLFRKGAADALYKHMLFLKDEREDFKKVRQLYLTEDGHSTDSGKKFGMPAKGLSKGIDVIIDIHDVIIDLQAELLKSGSRNPQQEVPAKLKRYFDLMDQAIGRLFVYAEGMGLSVD